MRGYMTAGTISYDRFSPPTGNWAGIKGYKTWSGADSPKAVKIPASFYTITRWESQKGNKPPVLKVYKVRRPGFTPKRARNADHPYTMEYRWLSQEFVDWKGRHNVDVNYVGAGSWDSSEILLDANDQLKLINKLTEQLQGSDFNLSVFLGEMPQTMRLLADTAIRVAKAGYYTKRGDIRGALRSLFEGTTRKPLGPHSGRNPTWRNNITYDTAKNLSARWLELQYGWLPLLNDAEACAQSLAHYLNYPLTTSVRASVRKLKRFTNSVSYGSDGTVTVDVIKSHRRTVIARLTEKPSVLAQLGLLDPEIVAWELVPFSFVADWFIPIGSYLEARAAASRMTGTFVTSNKRIGFRDNVLFNGAALTSTVYLSANFDRTISTSLDVPLPTFKPLEKALSVQHLRNALALVVGVFTGGPSRK